MVGKEATHLFGATYFSSSTQNVYHFNFYSPLPTPQTYHELMTIGRELIAYVSQFGCSIEFPLEITSQLPEDEFQQLLLDTHYYPTHTFFLSLGLDSHQKIIHADSGAFYDLIGANPEKLLYKKKGSKNFDVIDAYDASSIFIPLLSQKPVNSY